MPTCTEDFANKQNYYLGGSENLRLFKESALHRLCVTVWYILTISFMKMIMVKW